MCGKNGIFCLGSGFGMTGLRRELNSRVSCAPSLNRVIEGRSPRPLDVPFLFARALAQPFRHRLHFRGEPRHLLWHQLKCIQRNADL